MRRILLAFAALTAFVGAAEARDAIRNALIDAQETRGQAAARLIRLSAI